MFWHRTYAFILDRKISGRYATAILLGLLLLSFWLLRQTHPHTVQAHTKAAPLPQEYMKGVKVTIFRTDGLIKNALSADYWAYSPQTEHSILSQPKLTIYKPDQSSWQIAAQDGQVDQPNIGIIQTIQLSKNVVLQRPGTIKTQPIRVETQSLSYKPEKQYAETTQFVKMTKPALTITGIGLRAFLDNNWVELLHDVKTYYTSH